MTPPPGGARERATESRAFVRWPGFVAAAILATVLVLIGLRYSGPHVDFDKAYYPAMVSILETGTFGYEWGQDKGSVKNIPIVLGALAPIAALSESAGVWAFQGLNLLSYLAAFGICVRFFAQTRAEVWVLLFLFAAAPQIRATTDLGQLTPVTFLALTGAVACLLQNRGVWAGVLIAIAFLIKIPAGFLGLILLARRDWKGLAACALTVITAVLLSVTLFGLELHKQYWDIVIVDSAGNTMLAPNNQNIFTFLLRFWSDRPPFDLAPVPVPQVLRYSVTIAVVLWILALLKFVLNGGNCAAPALRRDCSILLCTSLMMFPVVWDHYYMFLILAFYSLYEQLREQGAGLPWWIAGAVAWVLVSLPKSVITWPAWNIALLQSTVVASYFLGGCLLLALHLRLRFLEQNGASHP